MFDGGKGLQMERGGDKLETCMCESILLSGFAPGSHSCLVLWVGIEYRKLQ